MKENINCVELVTTEEIILLSKYGWVDQVSNENYLTKKVVFLEEHKIRPVEIGGAINKVTLS